jgi:hypothetical protein
MSFRDPNIFAREREEESGANYDKAKQAMAQNEAEIENQAKAPLEPDEHQSEEARTAEQEQEAAERLAKIGRTSKE